MTQALTQTHTDKEFLRFFTRMLNACKLERQHHVLERRQCREQLEALEHKPHLLTAKCCPLVLVQVHNIGAIE